MRPPTGFALFRALRPALRAGTILVIYISGHGGRARFPAGFAAGFPTELEWQFFVTVDQAAGDRFEGILAAELSLLVDGCAQISANVTVIIDTCFSTGMIRGRADRIRSIGVRDFATPTHIVRDHEGFSTFSSWAAALRSGQLSSAANGSRVVRVNACSNADVAYEDQDEHGRFGGLLTLELCAVLEHARARRLAWRELISIVEQRIIDRHGEHYQRPVVSGPGERRIFECESVDLRSGSICFRAVGDTHWVRSGRVHGTSMDDVFAARASLEAVELRVVEVFAGSVPASSSLGAGHPPEPGGAGVPAPMHTQAERGARARLSAREHPEGTDRRLVALRCRGPRASTRRARRVACGRVGAPQGRRSSAVDQQHGPGAR
ncbi:MAG: hypothetical protein HC927_11770 [Deltaproteobacteria bacterium]|nr:hypothetical protein [Deltaproteobacteria bacterium]